MPNTIDVKDAAGSTVTVKTIDALIGTIVGVDHDASATGIYPQLIGGYAHLTQPDAVSASGDAVRAFMDADGGMVVHPHTNLESIVSGNASNTDGTSTQCIAAGASGIKHYLTTIILVNTSSSNIYVDIKDGTTVKLTLPLPANSGFTTNLTVPLPGTAATAWNFDPSAAASTVYCSMIGFKSKV